MKYSLVIFDWDGTLMDSTHNIVLAIQKTCADLNLPIPTSNQASWVIGLSIKEAARKVVPDITPAQAQDFAQRYSYHYLTQGSDIKLFTGIPELLQSLKERGVLTAVATGKSRIGLDRALKQFGLEHNFDTTRTADQTAGKPNPLMLEEILDELMVRPEQAIIIGDTSHDLLMARNAGIHSIGVAYGAHNRKELDDLRPNHVVDSVSELTRLLSIYTQKHSY
ncbi:HAD-IA family hydrolase [Taylorella equigenitalis]|uniref:HAD-IA family hydrolase n=1 Tax=Taylorella equigenitalis TaxID=29575 RepID=UPI00237DD514|nr:HAD-IA family hydrolase [Taylorella equigenitalis]WDU48303.1 HAD-IA family hydrolase [Taylorella equigenitalis]